MQGNHQPAQCLLITLPDAERLALQSRFVRNQVETLLLADLMDRIRCATLVDPTAAPTDLVTMNSKVVLREEGNGRRLTYTLTFPSTANARRGRISVLSPLGAILLGARTGQQLTCPIEGEIRTVVVEAIPHQPEAMGDYYG